MAYTPFETDQNPVTESIHMADTRLIECAKCKRTTTHEIFLTAIDTDKTSVVTKCCDCGHALTVVYAQPILRVRMAIGWGNATLREHPEGAHRPR